MLQLLSLVEPRNVVTALSVPGHKRGTTSQPPARFPLPPSTHHPSSQNSHHCGHLEPTSHFTQLSSLQEIYFLPTAISSVISRWCPVDATPLTQPARIHFVTTAHWRRLNKKRLQQQQQTKPRQIRTPTALLFLLNRIEAVPLYIWLFLQRNTWNVLFHMTHYRHNVTLTARQPISYW